MKIHCTLSVTNIKQVSSKYIHENSNSPVQNQFTVGKKMSAVHFTTMPCEPNTANKAKKAKFL